MVGKGMSNHVWLNEQYSFKLRVTSEGSETPRAVAAHNTNKVGSQFRPGKGFKTIVENTEFKKASG